MPLTFMPLSTQSGPHGAEIDVWLCAGLLAGRGVSKVLISQGFRGSVQQVRADV
jgi:hypothetical protein